MKLVVVKFVPGVEANVGADGQPHGQAANIQGRVEAVAPQLAQGKGEVGT